MGRTSYESVELSPRPLRWEVLPKRKENFLWEGKVSLLTRKKAKGDPLDSLGEREKKNREGVLK